MAILKPGQVGDFKGKIGQVVVSKWRQLTVGRSTPKKSSKKATEEQLNQQSKFGLVTSFIGRIGKTIALGYQNSAGNLTPYNVAVKDHIKNAVTGEYPNFMIDYSKVVLSSPKAQNEIDAAASVEMSAAVDAEVTITWVPKKQVFIERTMGTDLLLVVFYNVTEDAFMTAYSEGTRSSLTSTFFVPQERATDVIHAWAYFISVNKKFVSKSTYLGLVTS